MTLMIHIWVASKFDNDVYNDFKDNSKEKKLYSPIYCKYMYKPQ